MRPHAVIGRLVLLMTPAVALVSLAGSSAQGVQTPTFRTSTDVVTVDVQVVRADGEPVPTLTRDDFRVSIDRRRRNVLGAEFVSFGQPTPASPANALPLAGGSVPGQPAAVAPSTGRTFVVAIDLLTFDVGAARGVAEAARAFIAQLAPSDRIGLYPYPLGRRVAPTQDHAGVLRALDDLVGQKLQAPGRYAIGGADIVDWWAGENGRIIARECGGGAVPARGAAPTAGAGSCATDLGLEIAARTQEYEAQGQITTEQLKQLFQLLGPEPGRKFVVVMSGGMPLSDRPGGRPDGGTAAQDLGALAARGNIGLYALYLDSSFLDRFSASGRTANRAPMNVERDGMVSGLWLGQIAAGSGGALMKVLVGSGATSLARVIRETSAYYLLGVEPLPADADGRPHTIEVSVVPRGLTVRSRRWVVMNAAR